MPMLIDKTKELIMKVIDIRHIDLGDDGIVVNEFVFDKAISKTFIDYLSTKGDSKYVNSSIYKITFSEGCSIRGVEGTNTIRIYFSNKIKGNLSKVKSLFDNYAELL